jgi:hypothetical protein
MSTYTNLKIELLSVGDTGWGPITNNNFQYALEEAMISSADVTFASADVTLTLTNSNLSQPARSLRLVCTGTTGGSPRNLILGSGCQFEKPFIVFNSCNDAITIKNTSNSGVTVPALRTMWVYNNGVDVVDAINYVSTLTIGDLSGAVVGTTATQTLTGKTITYADNTLTGVAGTAAANTFTGANTFSAKQTLTGSTTALAGVLTNAAEVVTVSATAATGTIPIYATTQSVLYYTSNASANWVVNLTGASTPTTLNTLLSTGQCITLVFMATNGSTAYYNTSVQVDGTTSGVTTKWASGVTPSSGNTNSIDVYTYTVIKTGSATYTVLATLSKFA